MSWRLNTKTSGSNRFHDYVLRKTLGAFFKNYKYKFPIFLLQKLKLS